MPELPEVETIVRDLRGELAGRRFVSAWVRRPGVLRFPDDGAFTRALPGRRVVAVERRGKYILCRLDGDDSLVVHLGMTGHLRVVDSGAVLVPHTHLRAALDDGRELRFDDARRFGRVLLGPWPLLLDLHQVPRLGPEPLSDAFTPAELDASLRRTTRQLKPALLDQTVIAGLGSIYIDEACHLAGVRPTRRCHRLTRRERLALHGAIRAVLRRAVANRGTTIDDYRDLWNARGSNQEELRVYGRGGEPCLSCGATLRRVVVGGRSSVYCPACQR
ncbi:MAG: bifunctional DNA-formamidopyrimidine glycosylase/DNA-(apurinic or apyrimidinic site) lyase [Candidatus Dormibacteria bacterium]|jgi:formamidopyrimidine-DNA glycosylase